MSLSGRRLRSWKTDRTSSRVLCHRRDGSSSQAGCQGDVLFISPADVDQLGTQSAVGEAMLGDNGHRGYRARLCLLFPKANGTVRDFAPCNGVGSAAGYM